MNSTQKTMLETLQKTFNVNIEYSLFDNMTEEEIEEQIGIIEEKLFNDLFENK